MIIVSVTDPEPKLYDVLKTVAAADIVELRLDMIGECDLGKAISAAGKPVIATCRRESDGGEFTGSEEERLSLLRLAIKAGAEYVDIEVDAADKLCEQSCTVKRIVSFHNMKSTPPNLVDIFNRILSAKPDVAKIVSTATRPADILTSLEILRKEPPIPTIAFAMSDIGLPSRILCRKFGAFATYAAPDGARAAAPGQVHLSDLVGTYRYGSVGPDTSIYGLIGDPVAHSLSPYYHNRAFAAGGMDAVYLPFRVIGEPTGFLESFQEIGLQGLSVTHPFKGAFSEEVTDLDERSRETGNINTLTFSEGTWHGANTDVPAIREVLDDFIPDPMLGFTAVVLGAGGAAGAACVVLKEFGANVVAAARDKNKGKRFALEMDVDFVPLRDVGKIDALLMINATPVGMEPNVLESPVPKDIFRPGRFVWDFIYNPRKTRFLREAEEAHCKTLSGLSVFIAQARRQQQIWTDRTPPEIGIRDTG
ncbi:MAG: type I 3-dehydroquinate dehydratase [Planctomycetota bacterium]|nr:MAG: type I 3-dehydroquinate dehydratase [Planctomycetota bacterium]